MKDLNRIKGALYGVAIGDALGGPAEFMTAAEIQQKYGILTEMVGGGVWRLKPGETTDDTAMTIAVGLGITESPNNPVPAIGWHFMKWFFGNPKDIGNQTRAVLSVAAYDIGTGVNPDNLEWHEIAATYGGGEGNGALMRTIYPALYYNNFSDMQKYVRDIGIMTHPGGESRDTCAAYCELIYDAIRGKDIEIEELEDDIPPSGYVINTFIHALNSVKKTEDFESAVIRAVNLGGDADTIGAVAGGLAGAIYGYDAIPQRWIKKLPKKTRDILDKLAAAAA